MGNKFQKHKELRNEQGSGAKRTAQETQVPKNDSDDLGLIMNEMDSKLTVKDFTFLKVVGKGSFGKVMMVKKNDSGEIFALKVLKKKSLLKRKQIVHTKTERRILSNIENPFIVSLRYAFQTPAKLYMVLDFFNGGELFFHLKRDGRFTESRTRFYAAEILLALEELHSHNIVYRDLKPENILLDNEGHIKVTDFGLSKDSLVGQRLTHTFCGTPEYLAPEILQQQGHGKAVDWWSFGTLCYEMLTGLPPFYNTNLNIMYEKILHAPIPLPKSLTREARSLFLGLLERDVACRLGRNGATEIKEHPFFKKTDFEAMLKKEIDPPFKPNVEGQTDTSFVEDEFTNEPVKDTYVPATNSMFAAQNQFPGFTFDCKNDQLVQKLDQLDAKTEI